MILDSSHLCFLRVLAFVIRGTAELLAHVVNGFFHVIAEAVEVIEHALQSVQTLLHFGSVLALLASLVTHVRYHASRVILGILRLLVFLLLLLGADRVFLVVQLVE